MKEVIIMKNNNNNNQNNNNNYELNLSNMDIEQLTYLDKLLKENAELKQRYNQEIYSNNRNKSSVEIYGEVFASVTEAAQSLGIDRALVYYRIKKQDFPGYFVQLNQFGEIISRSKVAPKSKKNKEEDESK